MYHACKQQDPAHRLALHLPIKRDVVMAFISAQRGSGDGQAGGSGIHGDRDRDVCGDCTDSQPEM